MLNFIYYPVSAILWFWHQAFGWLFGEASGLAWSLAVVFLVFTLRALLYKPFVHQVRSMRKMQEFAPEMQRLKKKYGNDRQKLAAEMQKLQSEQGVNPLGGCLPVLVQVPVFIGLFHVLREFEPGKTENYIFDAQEVASFIDADIFGAKLGASVVPYGGGPDLAAYGTTVPQMLVVMIPLMIMAGIFTHITARHSVARQSAVQAENPQTAIMNKMMLYVFPIGVVVGAPFLPLAVLIYWVANNLWTLGQQYVVYRKIDAEETEKKEQVAAARQDLAPKPGQKPDRAKNQRAARLDDVQDGAAEAPQKKPGAKPVTRRPADAAGSGTSRSSTDRNGAGPKGADRDGTERTDGARASEAPTGGSAANGSSARRGGTSTPGGAARPSARRGRKRR